MLTPRDWTRVALGLAVVFAALNTVNALNKGGDAVVFFEGGRRLLHELPLYEGSSAADGFIGPPFQALFFAPFAAIAGVNATLARLLWHGVNILCLVAGITLTVKAWDASRARLGLPSGPWFPALFAPLAAVLLPLQTNFEHQNMNALLLAILAGATFHLTLGSAIVGGLLVGFATALKAFPALLIVYLAARRYWTACLASVVAATVLTVLPAFLYGVTGFWELVTAFWRLSSSGWPVRGNNQSLIAALDRLTGGFGATGVRTAAEAPVAAALFLAVAILLAAAALRVLVLVPRQAASVPREMAAATVLAILLAPIAWDHYWTLMFPAFLILYDSRDPKLLGQPGRYAFWIAAILTTGLSPLTVGRSGYSVWRQLSVSTIAAVITYLSLIAFASAERTPSSTVRSRR